MLSGPVTSVEACLLQWWFGFRSIPMGFAPCVFLVRCSLGLRLLLCLLHNSTFILRLLPWFSALLLVLIPSPRPNATGLMSVTTSALERSIMLA